MKPANPPAGSQTWPDLLDWLTAIAIALLVFSLEAYIANAIGRAQSLAYDGLGYAAHARVKYFQVGDLLHHPLSYLDSFLNYIAPLWAAFLNS